MEEQPQLDTNALSRQLAVYGREAQIKLMTLKVAIHGLNGVRIRINIVGSRSGQEPNPCRSQASVNI